MIAPGAKPRSSALRRIDRIRTSSAQVLADAVLAVAGVSLPHEYEVDVMGELNRILSEAAPVGLAALEFVDAGIQTDGLRVRWRLTLGIW